MRSIALVIVALALTVIGACRKSANDSPSAAQTAAPLQYNDPPLLSPGISVDDAYAAIPHRRTVWAAAESTVPSPERDYLKAMFTLEDEAVAARVAGLQKYSRSQFDDSDVDSEFDQLISFARSVVPPKSLSAYHDHVLEALIAQQKFFREWKSAGSQFPYAQRIAENPDARKASGELKAAYQELMDKYPQEGQTNKDAFFDYHCALDFM